MKKVSFNLSENSKGKKICVGVSFLIECNFIKKETLVQVFSYEFYEYFKNSYFYKHLWWILLKAYQHISCHWFLYIYAL